MCSTPLLVFTSDAWLSRRLRSALIGYCRQATWAPLFARDRTGGHTKIRMSTDAPDSASASATVSTLILITWADLFERTVDDVLEALDSCLTRVHEMTPPASAVTVALVPYGSYTNGSQGLHEYPSPEAVDRDALPRDLHACLLNHWRRQTSHHRLVVCPMILLPGCRSRRYPNALHALLRIGRGLAEETRAKVPAYFSRHALTLQIDATRDVNAVSTDRLVCWLVDRAIDPYTWPTGRLVYLQSRVMWSTVCDSAREGGVPLAILGDSQPLTRLDMLFNGFVHDAPHHSGVPIDMTTFPEARVSDLDSRDVPALLRAIASARCHPRETSYEDIGDLRQLDLGTIAALHARELPCRSRPSVEPDVEPTPVRYLEGGTGDVVLLLPPIGIGIEYFKPALEALLHDFRVIVWHPRAKTASNARTWIREELPSYVDDIRQVLEHERVTTCQVIAWCGGVRLLPKLLDIQTLDIRSLVLMAPLLGGREMLTRQAENTTRLCRGLADNGLDIERFLEEAKRRVRQVPSVVEQFAPDANGIAKSPLQYHPIGFFTEDMFDDAESVKDWAAATLDSVADMATVHERVRTFDKPALIVLGTHDGMLAYDHARCLVATMRQAILATVHGGNHYFLVEHGRTVATLLRTFLLNGSVGDVHPSIRHGARVRVHERREIRTNVRRDAAPSEVVQTSCAQPHGCSVDPCSANGS